MRVLNFVLFMCCSTSIVHAQDKGNWSLIETDAYEIHYPKEWQLDTSGRNKTAFIIFSKREKQDPFRENVNLVVQDLSNHIMNLESFVALSTEVIEKVADSKIIVNKTITNNHNVYHEIVWKGFVNAHFLKFKQWFFIVNNTAYVLTFTGEEKKFKKYINIGDKILKSFRLK